MLSPEQIYQNIERILESRGISDRQLLIDSGLKKNVMANMKSGSMPSADKIAVIAEYLDVPVDVLLGTKKAASDSSVRSSIIEKVYSLSDSQVDRLLAFLEGMVGE